MKFRTILLLLILGLIAAFAALNWPAFNVPSKLSLGLSEVEAPLGLVMLGIIAGLTTFFLIFVVFVQATALFEARRNAQELTANRELADKAEASRFTELRQFIGEEFRKLGPATPASGSSGAATLHRLERLEKNLLLAIEQSGNGLAAHLAEMDDRLTGHKVADSTSSTSFR
ncbi:MAG TPA: LapA family protein [Accumulibacter sp.]|nr:LapA family protein [Accumulibacter sp.]